MSRRFRSIAFVGVALAAMILLLISVVARTDGSSRTTIAPGPTASRTPSERVPAPGKAPPGSQTHGHSMRSYAIAAAELDGLPLDAAPGTVMDVWASWDPPLTKRPQVQPLIRDVVLERIAPPVSPDGPYVAVLLVSDRRVVDLIYGDRYGSLSVAIAPIAESATVPSTAPTSAGP